jgi:transcriptional regulator with XRE-family HTH domain
MPMRGPSPQLAATIAAARRAAGLSLDAVAVQARTTRSTLRLLERFGIPPRPEILRRICDALGLPLGDLPPLFPRMEE